MPGKINQKEEPFGRPAHAGRRGRVAEDLTGRRFGRLTVVAPTSSRDRRGCIRWKCICDCGQETEVSGASLVQGCTLSCGCLKRENQKKITERLHRGYGTCVEFLERRKYRSDNTSGHCGVSQLKNGRYRSYIGFRGKRYYLGTFDTYDEAVQARQEAEQTVYDSFLETYYEWKKKADADRKWKETHPLIFEVERKDGNLVVRKDTGRKKQPE